MPSSAMMNGPISVASPANPPAHPPFGRLALVPPPAFGDRAPRPRLGLSAKAPVRLRLILSD